MALTANNILIIQMISLPKLKGISVLFGGALAVKGLAITGHKVMKMATLQKLRAAIDLMVWDLAGQSLAIGGH